jgi:hypothetical protein
MVTREKKDNSLRKKTKREKGRMLFCLFWLGGGGGGTDIKTCFSPFPCCYQTISQGGVQLLNTVTQAKFALTRCTFAATLAVSLSFLFCVATPPPRPLPLSTGVRTRVNKEDQPFFVFRELFLCPTLLPKTGKHFICHKERR